MKIVFTLQALLSFQEALEFLAIKVSPDKLAEIEAALFLAVESLNINPLKGQEEDYLKDFGLGHRRLISGHFKIIYRVEGQTIYITDIFDSRQDPAKMKP
ncbi:MAG: type II toxin-antitoxin system RelE/ParE family toxin [Chitinophagales bacterium]|nr:type II toxin-antitoxin system RelE/ParE family toxin [Chitinophagales bacterium]